MLVDISWCPALVVDVDVVAVVVNSSCGIVIVSSSPGSVSYSPTSSAAVLQLSMKQGSLQSAVLIPVLKDADYLQQ